MKLAPNLGIKLTSQGAPNLEQTKLLKSKLDA